MVGCSGETEDKEKNNFTGLVQMSSNVVWLLGDVTWDSVTLRRLGKSRGERYAFRLKQKLLLGPH